MGRYETVMKERDHAKMVEEATQRALWKIAKAIEEDGYPIEVAIDVAASLHGYSVGRLYELDRELEDITK